MTTETSNARGELSMADIRADARAPLQLLRERLCNNEEGWSALCQLMPMLTAPPPAVARGEWVLVPRVPDADMLDAAVDAHIGFNGEDEVDAVWAAMLAAAPPPAAKPPRGIPPSAVVWQPIETAPKDNKRPLYLAQFNHDTGELIELDWDAVWEAERESWEMPQVYYIWRSANGRVEEPTHWAYQDAPPPAAEGVQAGEVEQRARELLATEYAKDERYGMAHAARNGSEDVMPAIRAIAFALSQQPEARGVVDEVMVVAIADHVRKWMGPIGRDLSVGHVATLHGAIVDGIHAAALTGERNG